MGQEVNQHEKNLSIALEEFYTREILEDEALLLIRTHRRRMVRTYKLRSVIFGLGLIAAMKDEKRLGFTCSNLRVYVARYPNKAKKSKEKKDGKEGPTMVIELSGLNSKGVKESRYFNYGQTCPPGDGQPENICDGDIDGNLP